VQKQTACGQSVNKFLEFCGPRGLIEFFRWRQLETIAHQGIERTDKAVGFQRKDMFQKGLFRLGIAIGHFAAYHFRTGSFLDLVAKFIETDFQVNRLQTKRIVVGFMVRHEASMADYSSKESPHRAWLLFYTF